MRIFRQGAAVALLSLFVSAIAVNASYFAWAFPGATEVSGASAAWTRLPPQRDAYRPPPPPDFLDAFTTRAALVTLDSGAAPRLLVRYRVNELMPLASLTKLMSALVMLDRRPDWSAVAVIRQEDRRGGAKQRIAAGDTLTIEDLWQLMLVGSDNDAAAALVRALGFSEQDFVASMNERAGELGLASTRFVEPTGLAPGNVSTAREFTVIVRAAFAEQRIAETLARPRTTIKISGIPAVILSTDQQLKTFPSHSPSRWEFITGKTGYIVESGYNVALSVRDRTGQRLLAVMLGARTPEDRINETERLLDWATAAAESGKTGARAPARP